MAKIKLSTSPLSRTITHTVNSPTLVRISWNADDRSIVDVSNIGTNLTTTGYRDVYITSNKTFIITAKNATNVTERIINIVYQSSTPTSTNNSMKYESGVAMLQNNDDEINLQG